ncbi:MAG: serine protein kinase RIO [Candidatus Micrarchaeia archaeon]
MKNYMDDKVNNKFNENFNNSFNDEYSELKKYNKREIKQYKKFRILKEHEKIDTGIFDKKTMQALSKFFNKGIISKVDYIIARGKEADVYIATPGASEIVKNENKIILKFFRIETSSFYNMNDYITGDPRFKKISNNKYNLINEWCKKEFGNLQIAEKAKIRAPRPFMYYKSILAMSTITKSNELASRLKDTRLNDPKKVFDNIIKQINLLYKKELVHADLSEYNILIGDEELPYFIDFGQAVVLRHPNAINFLKRDIENISLYFSKSYNIKDNADKIFNKIIKV